MRHNKETNTGGKTTAKKKPRSKDRLCRTVTIRLTEEEHSKAKHDAAHSGMKLSAFARSLFHSVNLRARLTDEEKELLRHLGNSRADIVNFANALSGLSRDEKLALFRNHRIMFEWYNKVADITNLVEDYLKSVMRNGIFAPRTTRPEKEGGNA